MYARNASGELDVISAIPFAAGAPVTLRLCLIRLVRSSASGNTSIPWTLCAPRSLPLATSCTCTSMRNSAPVLNTVPRRARPRQRAGRPRVLGSCRGTRRSVQDPSTPRPPADCRRRRDPGVCPSPVSSMLGRPDVSHCASAAPLGFSNAMTATAGRPAAPIPTGLPPRRPSR